MAMNKLSGEESYLLGHSSCVNISDTIAKVVHEDAAASPSSKLCYIFVLLLKQTAWTLCL